MFCIASFPEFPPYTTLSPSPIRAGSSFLHISTPLSPRQYGIAPGASLCLLSVFSLACSPYSLALFCDADYHLNSLLLSSSFPPALEIVAHVFGRLITVFFVPSLLEIRPDKFTWSLPSSRLG